MANHNIPLKSLRRILTSFGVGEDKSRGKGSHTLFFKNIDGGVYTYPVPLRKDTLECYVKGSRKKFHLQPADGVTDEDFYSRG
ncbi:MAG: hypothetical protein IID44_18660 [Planctomycetes bacterium]|nr:hypothetical protein [Planctomycetota bacterium]